MDVGIQMSVTFSFRNGYKVGIEKKTSVCAGPWTEGVKMGSFQVNLAQARLAMADVVQSYEEIRRPVHSGLLSSGKQLEAADIIRHVGREWVELGLVIRRR